MTKLSLVKRKDSKGLKYAIALRGDIVSRHRTLSGAKKQFNKLKRIARE